MNDSLFSPARWIWAPAQQQNQYPLFVKSVPLSSSGTPVRICIAASSHYELFLNGEFVARGPVHGDPQAGASMMSCSSRWKSMINEEATTAWEGFWGDDKDSHCHPWSTAPHLYLLESAPS